LDRDQQQAADYVRQLYRNESVVHLEDLLLRRTDWGLEPEIGRELGQRIGTIMNWSQTRVGKESSSL
jgi:hypothetical protein